MRGLRRSLAPLLAVLATLALGTQMAGAALVVPDGGFVTHGSTADVIRQIDIAHDAGARWVSLAASWESLEPQPDSYLTPGGPGTAAWSALEQQLLHAEARGVNVEVRLFDAPEWASGRAGGDDPPTPANLPAYASFLRDLAQRLGPYLDAYSPWNEPNRPAFWNPSDPDAFTALQKAAYPAIKAADPTATVLYGPVVGRYASQNSGYTFLRRSYQLGLKGYADAIGWNGYPGGEPESSGPVEGGVPAGSTLPAQLYLRDLIDQYDPGRMVWIMEMSWSTCAPCNVSAANGVTEAQQADYLTRAFTYRRRYLAGITERIFWYQLRDGGTSLSDWSSNQGVLRNDFSPKPALNAFKALGVEAPEGTVPDPKTVAAPVTGTTAGPPLPASALSGALPRRATSGKGRIVIGVPRLSARRGVFTLTLRIAVRGGTSRLQVAGFRAGRWRAITTTRVSRTGRLRIRFADRGYLGVRVRATVPGRAGWRAGRIVRVPWALRGALSARATSPRGRVVIGVPKLSARRGAFALTLKVSVRGGASRLRADGFRAGRWRAITTTRVTRSGRLRIRFPDRGYMGLRVRATVPGGAGWRAGRVVGVSPVSGGRP